MLIDLSLSITMSLLTIMNHQPSSFAIMNNYHSPSVTSGLSPCSIHHQPAEAIVGGGGLAPLAVCPGSRARRALHRHGQSLVNWLSAGWLGYRLVGWVGLVGLLIKLIK